MGRTRGPELVARMAEAGPTPRVLFITGYSEEAIDATLGHSLLTKPFTAEALRDAVHAALGLTSDARTAR